VKELIPEVSALKCCTDTWLPHHVVLTYVIMFVRFCSSCQFFYLPDFLRNSNGLDLGTKQDKQKLGDVVLPPWANGSAEEFIRIQRAALESEHVSSRLHEWSAHTTHLQHPAQFDITLNTVSHHCYSCLRPALGSISSSATSRRARRQWTRRTCSSI
jgi:hypothetical protein